MVSRYVFRQPFVWSDELASILFLWLAMLGAVVAFRRGEHMRMIDAGRARLAALARLLRGVRGRARGRIPGADPASGVSNTPIDEAAIVTPALEIPNVWRAAALPVGCALMLVFALLRLARVGGLGQICSRCCVDRGDRRRPLAAQAAAASRWATTIWSSSSCCWSRPACWPACRSRSRSRIATFAFLALTTRTPLTVVVSRMDEGMTHIILLSVPLFVFLGLLIEMTGMARAMVDFLASLLGHVRGGLSYVLLGAMYLVSGISGSKAADMAAVAPVLFPEMKRARRQAGRTGRAAVRRPARMSETIPPSLVLITIGSVTGVSIAALFTGGLLPALVLALGAVRRRVVALSRRRSRRRQARHVARGRARLGGRAARRSRCRSSFAPPWSKGVATATEVSTIGIVYTIIVCLLIYRAASDWRG